MGRKRTITEPRVRHSRVTVPARAHPIVRFLFAEMRRQGVTYYALAERSGLSRETITAWRTRNRPDLESIEAALGALGYDVGPLFRVAPLDLGGEITLPAAVRAGYRLSPALAGAGGRPGARRRTGRPGDDERQGAFFFARRDSVGAAGYRLAAARVRDATGAQGSGSRDHGARESKARPAAQLGGAHRNRASAVVTVAGGAHPRAADTPARLPATQHYRQSMSSARTACVQGGVPPGIGSNRPMITVRR